MKIEICDVCNSKGVLTKSTRKVTIKNKPFLKLSVCDKCKCSIPKNIRDFVRFAYKIHGMEVSDEQITGILL